MSAVPLVDPFVYLKTIGRHGPSFFVTLTSQFLSKFGHRCGCPVRSPLALGTVPFLQSSAPDATLSGKGLTRTEN